MFLMDRKYVIITFYCYQVLVYNTNAIWLLVIMKMFLSYTLKQCYLWRNLLIFYIFLIFSSQGDSREHKP